MRLPSVSAVAPIDQSAPRRTSPSGVFLKAGANAPLPIRRQRLLDRIETCVSRTLTLIVAGAGFGKSTILEQWAAETPTACGWLSTDERDGSVERLLRAMRAAIVEGAHEPRKRPDLDEPASVDD